MWFFSDAKSIFFKFLDVNDIMSCQNPPFKKTKKKKTSHAHTHEGRDGSINAIQPIIPQSNSNPAPSLIHILFGLFRQNGLEILVLLILIMRPSLFKTKSSDMTKKK